MLKEENTKNDLALGTINSLELIGDRILVLLDEAPEHTKTESGLILPLNNVIEKDSGRLGTEISKRKHLNVGTVLSIADFSKQKLEDQKASLKVGDRVYVSELAVSNLKSYQFITDRTKLVADFEGVVCIPHVLIEAKVNG